MKKTLVMLFTSLLIACPGGPEGANCRSNKISPLMESANLERDIKIGKMAERAEKALGTMLSVAEAELSKRGHARDAQVMDFEWNNQFKFTFRNFASGMNKDIGDHAGLSQWLTDKYNMIEAVLGKDICKQTHLSDIKTFNHTIPVVFRPCTFPMDSVPGDRISEYRRHFSEGEELYGLVPVTGFWICYAAITFGSSGTFVYFAGILSSIAEKAISFVTPDLSDFVYTKACGGI